MKLLFAKALEVAGFSVTGMTLDIRQMTDALIAQTKK